MCPTIVPLMRETKKEQDIYFTSLIETMKILVATEKPFAKKAVDGIRKIVEDAGYELALLEKYTDKGQLLEAVADVDALIVRSDKVTAEVIAAAKNLKIVVRAGAGYDNVDLAAASARGIVVMNTPGQNSNAVAELALAMMIFMSRNRFTPGTGTELQGKALGIHAEEARPDAVVLGYPVITSGIMTHGGSIKNLCGDDAELKATMSLENQIRGDLPPFFIWHTVEDGSVPVQNSLLLASALTEHKVPFELHLFNHDGHGTSTCTREVNTPNAHNRAWVDLCTDWLADLFNYHL